jgi:uncharacterized protein (DUF1501 family)
MNQTFMLTRRGALLGLTASFTLGRASLAFGAASTQNRFVVVILRGALDGMSAVQPYGDPSCMDVRGDLALPQPGADGGLLDLGGFYGLHPSLANLHGLYQSGDALILHATAGKYRSRSHFEAQDYLECGTDQRMVSGWLNRAVATMPGASSQDLALCIGLTAPLLLRGPARVEAWAPEHFGQDPSNDLYARLETITAHDPLLGPAIREGLARRGAMAGIIQPVGLQTPAPAMAMAGMDTMGAPGANPAMRPKQRAEAVLARAAGQMLAMPTGPRIAALEINGWDTHTDQHNRLKVQLSVLDSALAELRAGLGDSWRQTAVLVVTEFGRTARINGTKGTDHGTGGVTFLVGGAVAGGRVRADWPGLGQGQLYENRDLAPTADVRSIAKGVLASHMGLGAHALTEAFPGSADAQAMTGLMRA